MKTRRFTTGASLVGAPVFVFLIGVIFTAQVPADQVQTDGRLKEIMNLARAGAVQLAMRAMDAHQPDVDTDLQGWLLWERERVFVLMSQGHWQALAERLKTPPNGLPKDFYDWARELRARAFLKLGQGDSARRELGRNIWTDTGVPKKDDLARWRRLVIEAYLADGLDRDADRAMIRYRRDYADMGQDWPVLRAEVLLRTGKPEAAVAALPSKGGAHVTLLRTLGEMRGGRLSPNKALEIAEKLRKQAKPSATILAEAWALTAEAAGLLGRYRTQTQALEEALARKEAMSRSHPLAVTGDDLWNAYTRYGLKTANEAGLLMGDERAWMTLVGQSLQTPVKVRALLATLALEGTTQDQRERAHAELSRRLPRTDFGVHLLPHMYLNTKRFPHQNNIPAPVRYALTELYLDQGRIQQASAMISGLAQAPPGVDPFDWSLRRSRILILAGRMEEGHAGLTAILDRLLTSGARKPGLLANSDGDSPSPLGIPDAAKVNRFLQVVFDLQVVERHDLALPIFERLLQASLDGKQRRELYFWAGESAEALGKHHDAAMLYLRSAMFPDPFAMDPWAQTARFHAAQILAEQGLREDARSLYTGLLGATQDPARKAVLRQRIQQLMLQEQVP